MVSVFVSGSFAVEGKKAELTNGANPSIQFLNIKAIHLTQTALHAVNSIVNNNVPKLKGQQKHFRIGISPMFRQIFI